MLSVLVYHTLSCCLEIGSLPEPGARLVDGKPREPAVSALCITSVTDMWPWLAFHLGAECLISGIPASTASALAH